MGYNTSTFLKPYNSEDKNLLIFDENGLLKYTINPFSVLNIQIKGNIVTINIRSGRTILLDFLNNNSAIVALPLIQDRVKNLTRDKSVHIEKQVENWVEGIDLISATLTMAGNIVPSEDYKWNLGSTSSRWNNIYVRDAIVASQSLYIGDLKVSTDVNDKTGEPSLIIGDKGTLNFVELAPDGLGGVLIGGETNLDLYNGISETYLATPIKGEIVEMYIPIFQSWKFGDSIKVFNQEEDPYFDEEYWEDATYTFFIGKVDYYDPDSGKLELVIEDSYNIGFTFSEWQFKLNTDNPKVTNIVKDIDGDVIPQTAGTFNLGTAEKSWNNLYIGDSAVSVLENDLTVDGVKISKYEGISADILTTPEKGQILRFFITPGLDLAAGKSIKVENQSENLYVDDYSDDDFYTYFSGIIESYDLETGELSLLVQENFGVGLTSSSWQVKLNTDVPKIESLVENISASMSIDGNLVPLSDITWNLGTAEKSWNNLYIGDIAVAVEDSALKVNDTKIAKFEGTSETYLVTPAKGEIITIYTNTGLDLSLNKSIKVENQSPSFYSEDYWEEDTYTYFTGLIDFYDSETGQINMVVEESFNTGLSSSTWQIRLNTDTPKISQSIDLIDGPTGEVDSVVTIIGEGLRTAKIYFGTVSENQSIYVNSGNLFVNDTLFVGGGGGGGGSQGPQGPQGVQGNTGPQGLVGQAGADAAATLNTPVSAETVIVVTHSYGTYPLVQVLKNDYTILASDQYTVLHNATVSYQVTFNSPFTGYIITGGGLTGPAGEVGPQGALGGTGSQGNTGPQGSQGLVGSTGPQGFQGIAGATGSDGQQPDWTFQGVWSSGIFAAIGDIYTYDGQTWYSDGNATGTPSVANGWYLLSAKGSTGPQGISGGGTGSQGYTGPQGSTGFQGPSGPQGIGGPTGVQGYTGIQGTTGPQGATGPTITAFTFSNDVISIVLTTVTYSVTINQFTTLATNNITVNTFNGSSNRLVEATTTGSLTASRSLYTTYITDANAQSQIIDSSNWTTGGVWIGTTVSNVYAGQRHYDINYLYEAVTGNGSNATFIRLLRG